MTAREARDAAKLVAAEYVDACCPWATAWRVTSSRPKAELGWGHHRAMLAVKMIDGTEKAVVEIDRAASEEAALTMLGQEMLRRIAKGVREPDPYEATCRRAFGPPPDGWASWSSMPEGFRQGYAAARIADGAARRQRVTVEERALDDEAAERRAVERTGRVLVAWLIGRWRDQVSGK